MARLIRILGVGAALLMVVAARADAASVTLAWDPNSESDISGYYVGYRTSPSGAESLSSRILPSACSGSPAACMWTFPSATAGTTYYFRVYAENTSGLRSAPSNEVSTTIPTTPPPPTGGGLALERGALNYGAVVSGTAVATKTPAQRLAITQTASGSPVSWTASSTGTGSSRISVSPTSGTGTAAITVTLASTSLSPGTYTNNVRVTVGSTQLNVPVTTRVYASGSTTAPVGSFDTPVNGSTNVSGAVAVTGWTVDDVGVSRVDIYRDPVAGESGLVFLGTASIIAGSRPDVENVYPNAPLNYRTGWGFMVLSNMLPDQSNGRPFGGNGPFRLHAYSIDLESKTAYLGAKNFTANNTGAAKPFGTIDTPGQGATISGNYTVFGWALSPRGTIPTNGSTMMVYIDGVGVGRPTYNNYRSDIANAFPGFANSAGAVGYYMLDTTRLSNGTHTIAWTATDNLGNTEGLGSRFFTVQNSSSGLTAATSEAAVVASAEGSAVGKMADDLANEVPTDYSAVHVKKAASDDPTPELVFPEWTGEIRVRTREADQVELRLGAQFGNSAATYEGYVVMNGRMRSLPVGSTLNKSTGVFSWQPGPGFIGRYEFVFLRTSEDGSKTRIPVIVRILPRNDDGDGR